jgi:adenine-specific DNA-methyltransferase
MELLSLQHAMNEVLGEENLLGVFVWKSRAKPTNAGAAIYRCQRVAEYVLAYGRSSAQTKFFPLNSGEKRSYPFDDRGRKYRTTTILTSNRGRYRRESMRFALEDFTPPPEQRWKAGPAEIHDLRKRGFVEFRDGIPFLKHYEDEERDEHDPLWTYLPEAWTGTAETGKEELSDLVGPAHGLDSVKPVSLIRLFVQAFTEAGDTVLDFYAGSCTTAHAVWEENLWGEHGRRNCIMVQYPEPSPKSSFSTIAELGKERMRRAGQMLKGHTPQQTDLMKPVGHLDMGFRVYKVAESNMKPWKGTDERDPEKYAETMEMFLDPLVDGWRPENVIAEVALKEAGYGLNCRVEPVRPQMNTDEHRLNGAAKDAKRKQKNGKGPDIFKVTDTDKEQFFYICLDDKVRLEDVRFLNLTREMLFVCRDVALDDETAANLALQCRLRTI